MDSRCLRALRPGRRRTAGVTIIELMIVVVVLGILSTLGMMGYRRYMGRARSSEAVGMLAEMVSKEGLYFLEFAQYYPLVYDVPATPIPPAPAGGAGLATEAVGQWFPQDPSSSTFDSVRVPRNVGSCAGCLALPPSWTWVAVRPKEPPLFCTYFLNAGLPGSIAQTTAPATGPPYGGKLMGTAAIAGAWYYALGACNLGKSGTWAGGKVSVFALTSDSPSLKVLNEGE